METPNYLTNVASLKGEESIVQQLRTDSERAAYLEALLCAYVTNGIAETQFYPELRQYFLKRMDTRGLMPRWIRTFKSMNAVWEHLRYQGKTSEERQVFIKDALRPLKDFLASSGATLSVVQVGNTASSEGSLWHKASNETWDNPEGALTLATLAFETTLQELLEDLKFESSMFLDNDLSLYGLYQELSKRLELYPAQQKSPAFAAMLEGVSEIVSSFELLSSELDTALANQLSPAQTELSVKLAKAIAEFLAESVLSLKEL